MFYWSNTDHFASDGELMMRRIEAHRSDGNSEWLFIMNDDISVTMDFKQTQHPVCPTNKQPLFVKGDDVERSRRETRVIFLVFTSWE